MVTVTADSKNAKSGNKNELSKTFSMIKNSKVSWFTKTMAFIVFPFVLLYIYICGLIQMILYPILYFILTIIYDKELRNEVAYSMRKVWSTDYWF